MTDCQVNYAQHHRTSGRNAHLYGFGPVNIAFADGHVELLRHDELFDAATGRSTYRTGQRSIVRSMQPTDAARG